MKHAKRSFSTQHTAHSTQRRPERGLTLMEILVSLVLVTLIAGGTLIGFMLAGRVSQESVNERQAVSDATKTVERFRNKVAADDSPVGLTDPLVAGSSSYSPFLDPSQDQDMDGDQANRQYTVTAIDFTGPGGVPDGETDYYRVSVNVHFDEPK